MQFMLKLKERNQEQRVMAALTSEHINFVFYNSQGTVTAYQSLRPVCSVSGLSLEFNPSSPSLSPFSTNVHLIFEPCYTKRSCSTHALSQLCDLEYTAPTTLSAFPTLP